MASDAQTDAADDLVAIEALLIVRIARFVLGEGVGADADLAADADAVEVRRFAVSSVGRGGTLVVIDVDARL